MKSQAFGRIAAMLPGVRTMPTEMELPTATAMPKPTPRTWRSLPLSLRLEGLGSGESREAGAVVVDKVVSRSLIARCAIIRLRVGKEKRERFGKWGVVTGEEMGSGLGW